MRAQILIDDSASSPSKRKRRVLPALQMPVSPVLAIEAPHDEYAEYQLRTEHLALGPIPYNERVTEDDYKVLDRIHNYELDYKQWSFSKAATSKNAYATNLVWYAILIIKAQLTTKF